MVDLPSVHSRRALAVPVLLVLAVLVAYATFGCSAPVHKTSALRRVQTIRLPEVAGRIDHLAVDLTDQRLFIAALENNTLEVVDLKTGKRIDRIDGLREPQGVAYVPASHKLIVTNGGGGTAAIYDSQSLRREDEVSFGSDPDNVRYDPATDRAYIGYGEG